MTVWHSNSIIDLAKPDGKNGNRVANYFIKFKCNVYTYLPQSGRVSKKNKKKKGEQSRNKRCNNESVSLYNWAVS